MGQEGQGEPRPRVELQDLLEAYQAAVDAGHPVNAQEASRILRAAMLEASL